MGVEDIHPEMRRVMEIEADLRGPAGQDIPAQRAAGQASAAYWNAGLPEMASVEDRVAPGPAGPVRVRIYRPVAGENLPALFFIHGGAFIVGSIEQNEPTVRGLAAAAGVTVVSTSYRLAPENPFPAGLDDCVAALRWTRANAASFGGDPDRLAIAGVSAGANLAVAAAIASGVPLRAALLVYGVFGTATDTDSYRRFGGGEYGLSRARMEEAWAAYVPPAVSRDDPRIAVAKADLAGLPPAHLVVAELDPLRDDSVDFAGRLKAAGVPVSMSRHAGMLHGFINRGLIVAEAKRAIAMSATFLRERLD